MMLLWTRKFTSPACIGATVQQESSAVRNSPVRAVNLKILVLGGHRFCVENSAQ
jgi:hypothetical protein